LEEDGALNIDGLEIEQAVASQFLKAVTPAALKATLHGATTSSQP
jgi:hypothetical protein